MWKKVVSTTLCFLGALLFALCASAEAQQTKRTPRMGYLSLRSGMGVYDEAFRQGLRELGYAEGQNIVIEWRDVKGRFERYHEPAAELVRLIAVSSCFGSGTKFVLV